MTPPTLTLAPKRCETCGETMEHVGRNVYVCPVSRTEARMISDARRECIRALIAERVAGVDF